MFFKSEECRQEFIKITKSALNSELSERVIEEINEKTEKLLADVEMTGENPLDYYKPEKQQPCLELMVSYLSKLVAFYKREIEKNESGSPGATLFEKYHRAKEHLAFFSETLANINRDLQEQEGATSSSIKLFSSK